MLPSIRRVALALVFAWAVTAVAGDRVALVSFQRVPVPADVPAHLCSAIAEDRTGLLWFGTQGGLVRYDGYEFRVFRSSAADPSTLGGNYVRAVLVASDGRLWIGSFSGGLSLFDPATETFVRFRHDPRDLRSLAYDRVEGLAESRDGSIWIATSAGLDRLDPRTRRIEHFRHDPLDPLSLADDRVRGLLVDRGGTLWVGTRNGLQRRRPDGRGFERAGFAGEYVTKLFEDRRGRIWIGTEEGGAAVLEPSAGSLHRFLPRPRDPEGLSHYWVYGFAEVGPGEMWIATFGGGIDVVDTTSLNIVDRLRADPFVDDSLRDDRIGAIFRDRTGAIWVGTWGEGLARHDPRRRAFRSMRYSPNRPDGLTHRAAVRALEMQDGTIWVGTNGNGVDILDQQLHRIGGHRPAPHDAGALADGSVTCLAQSADGTIWVATLNSMLHRRLPGSTRFDRLPVTDLPGGPIRTIAFTNDGFVWAGAAEGMARIDPRTLATRVYRRWPGAAASSPAIESIAPAADGTLWVGTDNGLYSFDPRTEKAVRIARDARRRDGLPENWVPALMTSRTGRLWAGTAGGAAILQGGSAKGARFTRVSTSPAEALIEDAAGRVWVGPRLRVEPNGRASRAFGQADGVEFRNFFIASAARTRDGRLLFGSPEGLLIVQPSAIPPLVDDTNLIPTALRVEGTSRPGATAMRALTLSPRERTFTLEVAALDFEDAPHRQYRYRLAGLDDAWTVAGASQRAITYSRIPPGTYTLVVGSTTRDGRWSSHELRVPVTVIPAFRQTILFRFLAAAAVALLAYLAYRLRVRQLRARQRALEARVAEATRELSEAYARIEQASLTDPLTQLHNRRYLEQTIDGDLELALREKASLVVLLIDLDHFKLVNDRYGHAAGDAVLVELARVLRATVRASDVIVRWGGEEFLVVVRLVDPAVAPDMAEKVRAAVAAHEFILPDGTSIRRTCSIGVAVWPGSSSDPRAVPFDRVVERADAALYEAKRQGRDRWRAAAE